jgi:intracellular multiplication protein IcmD
VKEPNPKTTRGQKGKKHKNFSPWLGGALSVVISTVIFYVGAAHATGTGLSVGDVAKQITASFEGLAKLITASSYIAGMGFALSAILKFKQHKDNPTQIPVGTPIALLFIAAALIFLPSIFSTANQTLFSGAGISAGISGITS